MVYSNLLIHNNILDKSHFYIKNHNKKHITPYLSKTLHKYLSNVKKLIEECHEEWDNKKKITNPYEYIHTLIVHKRISVSLYKPLSRSFFKLIELSNTHYLLSDYTKTNINTFSLAEGPGGFIEALMWLRNNKEDNYYGITLLSNDKNIPGWRKSNNIINNKQFILVKGETKDGNILQPKNLEYCYRRYKNHFELITADGGFDFSINFNNQEIMSSKLILAEVLYALLLQKEHGNFILKIFDSFTLLVSEIIYILSCFYTKVYISKPNTSRYANSEKYIVCKQFKLKDSSIYFETFYNLLRQINEKSYIYSILSFKLPYNFIVKLEEINILLGEQQISTILNTIHLIKSPEAFKVDEMVQKHVQKCIAWCKKHNIEYNKTL
uniref:FtsJ-like methyltransferase n=1 Tax=Megaviridae environmental sample TaxID=1737588 RepID=A0A5J6VMR9_9VIRU|nr:MAG: FtsJ-like methyltransferase [Megaviridae environmental sample]